MEQTGDLLFVYGSLKRGLANHRQLDGAPFAGAAQMSGLELYDLGPFPMAIAGEGTIRGELYRVDDAQLARLDRFEGAPRLYERQRLRLSDGRQAWIYLGRPRQVRHSPRLAAGCWPAASAAAPDTPAPVRPVAFSDASTSRLARAAASEPAGSPRVRLCLALVLGSLAGLISPLPLAGGGSARAEANLALCQRWQRSSGPERIRLGNAIGAAAYLTKRQRFAESDPQLPQLLYDPSDLVRACGGRR